MTKNCTPKDLFPFLSPQQAVFFWKEIRTVEKTLSASGIFKKRYRLFNRSRLKKFS
jgi:hypothetical protein